MKILMSHLSPQDVSARESNAQMKQRDDDEEEKEQDTEEMSE